MTCLHINITTKLLTILLFRCQIFVCFLALPRPPLCLLALLNLKVCIFVWQQHSGERVSFRKCWSWKCLGGCFQVRQVKRMVVWLIFHFVFKHILSMTKQYMEQITKAAFFLSCVLVRNQQTLISRWNFPESHSFCSVVLQFFKGKESRSGFRLPNNQSKKITKRKCFQGIDALYVCSK